MQENMSNNIKIFENSEMGKLFTSLKKCNKNKEYGKYDGFSDN